LYDFVNDEVLPGLKPPSHVRDIKTWYWNGFVEFIYEFAPECIELVEVERVAKQTSLDEQAKGYRAQHLDGNPHKIVPDKVFKKMLRRAGIIQPQGASFKFDISRLIGTSWIKPMAQLVSPSLVYHADGTVNPSMVINGIN